MLFNAVFACVCAAGAGLVRAASVLRVQVGPWALSLVHAALGATGLVLTLVAVLGGAGGHAPLALIILLVAALGGFFLASFHLRKAPAPKPVVIVHAAVAVIGVVLLGCTAFGIP